MNAKRTSLFDRYYAALEELGAHNALFEGAASSAFQNLLADSARPHHWTLIPQLPDRSPTKNIRPDGTLKDPMGLVRGHWEAKDTNDHLDTEIAKKTKKGYPLANIIFEDTRNAVLIQNKAEAMRIDMADREQLARLLDAFFDYVEPQIESFEKAVDEFKERVPDIAKHLKQKIEEAHEGSAGPPRVQPNAKFKAAFASFMELCRSSLNPGITQSVVDDMLVQHLLTERLIREIFDNPEFTRRNVIAAEIEKVIAALTSKSFDRNVFLKSLDRFYVAIENAARTITEWSDKQHFLNTVYERFFQGYSVKLADTMGIVYTPQPIVDFMCASVAEVLEKEFGKSLGDPDVRILDPCTGTGNFIVNLIRRMPKKDLPRVYREQLFANEIMLLPYYIAALNIEHAYYEQTGDYEPFEGLCFVDTLDLAEEKPGELSFVTEKNTERVERQKRTPITVIIGNPPYNSDQQSENDNNRNRSYPEVDRRIRETYVSSSSATNKNKYFDAYVRFLRWASDRLRASGGIVAFITNNNFVESKQLDGIRVLLRSEFEDVFHLDLHGDVRKNPKLSGTTHNVFGIQTGVGITLCIRRSRGRQSRVHYWRIDNDARREAKYRILNEATSLGGIGFIDVPSNDRGDWVIGASGADYGTFMAMGSKEGKSSRGVIGETVFTSYGPGLQTNRDEWVYGFDGRVVLRRMKAMAEVYNADLDRWIRNDCPPDIDGFVTADEAKIKWSSRLKETFLRQKRASAIEGKLRTAIYRPFVKRVVLFDDVLNHRPGLMPRYFPSDVCENLAIVVTCHSQIDFSALVVNTLPDVHVGGRPDTVFPLNVFEAGEPVPNITVSCVDKLRSTLGDATISDLDVFYYIYAVLHNHEYRESYAEHLKRDLPRIPFGPAVKGKVGQRKPLEASGFWAFSKAGAELARLHLDYEKLESWPLKWIETPGVPLDYRVEKMKLSKDKTTLAVNKSLALAGIPPEVFEYRLGNRSALDWVIDQYQVSTDKRSGIVSDPNRDDDPEYIVRLVGQVVRVSIETVKIVNNLPPAFTQ